VKVSSRSIAAIEGSNPAESMDVRLWCLFCVVRQRSVRRADHSFGGILPSVCVCVCVCVCLIMCGLGTLKIMGPMPDLGCCATEKEKIIWPKITVF
jgi:hypothetical protein